MTKKNIIIHIFSMIIELFLLYYFIKYHIPLPFIILNLVLLFLYNVYFITQQSNLIRKIENLENYNENISNLYDNIRTFKHDFYNIVYTIGGFISNNDMINLKKYYNDLLKDCQKTNNIATLNPKIINNSGIYNLLILKIKKAKDLNIDFNLECFLDFNKLNMQIYEFSRVLGILLDNAIEAASISKEKQINVLFRNSSQNKTQLIDIQNTYSNKNVDTTEIFEKGVTGKNNHSGIGLWEVNKIIKRNNNIKLVTTKDEKFFKQHLEIYY